MKQCHFHIEIYAPDGMRGIEPHLSDCELPLEPWTSGFNGQVILRYVGGDDTDFSMDASTAKTMHASGYIHKDASEAWRLLESLSHVLSRAGFPHRIGMDDNLTDRTFWVQLKCSVSGSSVVYEV